MKAYVCGIISKGGTLSESEIRANVSKFSEAELLLRSKGYDVFNPAHHNHNPNAHFVPSTSFQQWAAYMRIDIRELMDCDVICPLPGWEKSRGARLEMYIARELGMDVVQATEDSNG